MGVGLTHPVSSKVLHRKGNEHFRVGTATMHGWRETMEDAHTLQLSMEKHKNTAFLGIFDGHSGSACSKYIAERLPLNIDNTDFNDLNTLAQVVMQTDQDFLDSEQYRSKEDGSAGIFTLATYDEETQKYKLIHANIGDSRTVLGKKISENEYFAVTCTHDHKPTNDLERRRIENAGGIVQLARVDGQLALSRAFGDRLLKSPATSPMENRKVTSFPDFIENEATKDDFLFLACDGIYEGDVFTRETVIKFVSDKLAETNDLAAICVSILDECLKRGSRDNMSAMIVQFVDGTSYDQADLEYQPGPYYQEENDTKFRDAYCRDAKEAGYTLEEALVLLKQNEQKNQPQQTQNQT